MDAGLDTPCTVVYCTAGDLLPEARHDARRRVPDAALVTLRDARAIVSIPADRVFLAMAGKQLTRLCPQLPAPTRPETIHSVGGSAGAASIYVSKPSLSFSSVRSQRLDWPPLSCALCIERRVIAIAP